MEPGRILEQVELLVRRDQGLYQLVLEALALLARLQEQLARTEERLLVHVADLAAEVVEVLQLLMLPLLVEPAERWVRT